MLSQCTKAESKSAIETILDGKKEIESVNFNKAPWLTDRLLQSIVSMAVPVPVPVAAVNKSINELLLVSFLPRFTRAAR